MLHGVVDFLRKRRVERRIQLVLCRTGAGKVKDDECKRQARWIVIVSAMNIFFSFHPRDYHKLSLCLTFSNTFDNLWKSRRAYSQWRMLYKLQYDQAR